MSSWLTRVVAPLLFGLALAFVLTGMWNMRAQPSRSTPAQIYSPPPVAASDSWAGLILEKNILALEVVGTDAETVDSAGNPESFSLRLLGTITGTSAKALIRDDKELLLMDQGDKVRGWELTEVRPDSVVFLVGGRHTEIQMWSEPVKLETSVHYQSVPVQSLASTASGTRVTLSRQEVQPLLSDPNALLQMASFKPFTVDGRVGGFQVLSIRPDSLLYKVGLRNGDVLARINGQTLSGPTQLLQAYSGMDQSSLISLDVQRASQMLTYILELE